MNKELDPFKLSDPMSESDDKTYYSVCFIFLLGVVIGASVCNDLSFIMGLISAVYESIIAYILPGIFFIQSMRYSNHFDFRKAI